MLKAALKQEKGKTLWGPAAIGAPLKARDNYVYLNGKSILFIVA